MCNHFGKPNCGENQFQLGIGGVPGGVGHGPKGIMGKKIKNGSFASDLRFVHISRYAIKIPGEIV